MMVLQDRLFQDIKQGLEPWKEVKINVGDNARLNDFNSLAIYKAVVSLFTFC